MCITPSKGEVLAVPTAKRSHVNFFNYLAVNRMRIPLTDAKERMAVTIAILMAPVQVQRGGDGTKLVVSQNVT